LDPGSGKNSSRIRIQGVKKHRIPDPDPQHWLKRKLGFRLTGYPAKLVSDASLFLKSLSVYRVNIENTTNSLPTLPTTIPLFLMASGMARIPVPMLPFNTWIMVSQFLNKVGEKQIIIKLGNVAY
jgi:hypothetical protein